MSPGGPPARKQAPRYHGARWLHHLSNGVLRLKFVHFIAFDFGCRGENRAEIDPPSTGDDPRRIEPSAPCAVVGWARGPNGVSALFLRRAESPGGSLGGAPPRRSRLRRGQRLA